jgi:hypothetical protein
MYDCMLTMLRRLCESFAKQQGVRLRDMWLSVMLATQHPQIAIRTSYVIARYRVI